MSDLHISTKEWNWGWVLSQTSPVSFKGSTDSIVYICSAQSRNRCNFGIAPAQTLSANSRIVPDNS